MTTDCDQDLTDPHDEATGLRAALQVMRAELLRLRMRVSEQRKHLRHMARANERYKQERNGAQRRVSEMMAETDRQRAAQVQPMARVCATEGCGLFPTIHFIRGNIGTDYCLGCYLREHRQSVTAPTAGRAEGASRSCGGFDDRITPSDDRQIGLMPADERQGGGA